jgi:transposase
MLGIQREQKDMFSYNVDLDQRVRPDNILRRIKGQVSWEWVRGKVAHFYGYNGNESVDPVVIVKMLLLLFLDNVRSERELMRIIPERLDYLWFLGYSLDDRIPDHSVLSKARARWGRAVFEEVFVHTVGRCVEAGLVEGRTLMADGSLVEADAAKTAVVQGPPELIAALKRAYAVQERKLEEPGRDHDYERRNERMVNTTDPDAPAVRQSRSGRKGDCRPRYKHHRALDPRHGVITAQTTTPGDVGENALLEPLIDQHEANTEIKVETAVGDAQYGTVDNIRRLQERGIATHMACMHGGREHDIFPLAQFAYDQASDTYTCPGGQKLFRTRDDPRRQVGEYHPRRGVCAACPAKARCTRAKAGRMIRRHRAQELVDRGQAQAYSPAARLNRRLRDIYVEGSFGQAATNHHFKRARWRRLWRQQIQDALICAVQNLKILIKHAARGPKNTARAAATAEPPAQNRPLFSAVLFLRKNISQSMFSHLFKAHLRRVFKLPVPVSITI